MGLIKSVFVCSLFTGLVLAENVSVPNEFRAGSPASATEVNANFTALENGVNINGTRINEQLQVSESHERRIGIEEAKSLDHEIRITAEEDLSLVQEGRIAVEEAKSLNHDNRLRAEETKSADYETRISVEEAKSADHESRISNVESHIVKRYFLSNANTGNSVPVDQDILEDYCADVEGCRIVMQMTGYSGGTAPASRTYQFFYTASGAWRADSDATGTDGSSGTQHAINIWSTCFLTDGRYAGHSNLGDTERGMALLKWTGYSSATCHMMIED